MSDFVLKKVYLHGMLLHYFIKKKPAAEEHRILVEIYGDHAQSETICWDWLRRFKKIKIFMLKIRKLRRTVNVWKRKIRGITSWRLMLGASWTRRIIRSWSHNSFETFESIRNDLEARILGAVQVEAERWRMTSGHVWTAVSTAEKERFLCIVS